MGPRWLSFFLLSIAAALPLPGCGNSSPAAPTPTPCIHTLSTSSLAFGASGGSASVTVTTASHCAWTAVSDNGWMSITSGATGTGNGVVSVSVTPNPGNAVRTGTLTIADRSVAVREDALECAIEISPGNASLNKDSATGSFTVTTPAQCQWSATSDSSWVTLASGSSGMGNGVVSYAVERNRETVPRRATIAVGERAFTIDQSGDTPAPPAVCEYSVTPIEFNPCMSVSYTLTAAVTTQQGCTWTATPAATWISMTGGQSGTGSGTITFTVADNWDAPRHAVVEVRWPTATAGQNLHVWQAGCRYAVSVTSVNMTAAGGTGRFDVIQQSEPLTCGGALQSACVWTARADVPWITVTTTMPQAGDNPVSFAVAANDNTTSRTGTITVRDQVVRITQSAR